MLREVHADVDRAVPRAYDHGVLAAEQRAAGELGGVHDSTLEVLSARKVGNRRPSERPGGENDVGRVKLDLDAVSNDAHVPATIRFVVRRTGL